MDLSALASEISRNLERAQPDRNVTFKIASGLTKEGDPMLLRVVMENLLDNAWKFTSKQSSASIEFGRSQTNGRQGYFVKDNGAGFNRAYASKLFGAFQRLHGQDEFQGTGIGLATVQRIINRHGGEVWAEGAVAEGATFYFTLPPGRTWL